jgi:4-hydroxybenzoate polyprenyltransferase/phosphoserine phosphatase
LSLSPSRAFGVADRRDEPPLCVDLDGTLIRSDLLLESLFIAIRSDASLILRLPFIAARGRAALKAALAECADIDPALLPYNEAVLAFVREQRAGGRRIVLASASHRRLVEPVARHLGLFDAVEATEGASNLKGQKKADRLIERFGERGFDYIGDAAADGAVWKHARQALVVGAKPRADELPNDPPPVYFPAPAERLRFLLKAMRLHQWVKNLLVFTVLIAAHAFADVDLWIRGAVAFLSFGCCASSVYILNDLLDLQLDRAHPRKRRRPFASGRLPLAFGLAMAPLLLLGAALLAALLPPFFGLALAYYYVTTCAYSLWLKRIALIDVFALAALYTLRLIAGAAALAIAPSFWLLAFSMFLFLGLAIVKRYAEVIESRGRDVAGAPGRGYQAADAEVLVSLGTASAFAAVVVLALYVNSETVMRNYRLPPAIWLLCPLLLYWLSRLWLKARRGLLDDDPIVFALRDGVSLMLMAISAVIFTIAIVGPVLSR